MALIPDPVLNSRRFIDVDFRFNWLNDISNNYKVYKGIEKEGKIQVSICCFKFLLSISELFVAPLVLGSKELHSVINSF